MKVIFCHGLESAPHGSKYHALRECFPYAEVEAPDFRGMDLAERVLTLDAIRAAEKEPVILVGSSYGGITAMCSVEHDPSNVKGLVLCAPAIERDEPPATGMEWTHSVPTIIVHGKDDDVIPLDVSVRYARKTNAVLLPVDDGHRLSTEISLAKICDAVSLLR